MVRPWLAVISLWCSACSPLIATVGYDDSVEEPRGDAAAADAAAPVPEASVRDATVRDSASGQASPEAAGPVEDAGAMLDERCVLLPDLLGAHARDAATLTLDTGVVTAALDEALGCPTRVANAVSYTRNDGAPLVRANQAYLASWAPGPGGSATAYATNTACEQPFLGNLATWYYIAPNAPMCGPASILNVDMSLVRLVLSTPSPFPDGLMLCQATCP